MRRTGNSKPTVKMTFCSYEIELQTTDYVSARLEERMKEAWRRETDATLTVKVQFLKSEE